jgi:hypothetical protein
MSPAAGRRRWVAIISAATASSVRIGARIGQPTILKKAPLGWADGVEVVSALDG